MIPVSFEFSFPIPSNGGFLTDFNSVWNFDVGAAQARLESLGYVSSVGRDFGRTQILVNFRGVPDYFSQSFGGNQNYYQQQAQLDAQTAISLAATGTLPATQWQTPATYIQNQLPDASSILNNLPGGGDAGTILGIATPIIFLGAVLLLVVALKK